MVQKIIAVLCAVVFIGNFLLCYLQSRGKYDDYLEGVDKEKYALKDFIPLGLRQSERNFPEQYIPISLQSAMAKYDNQVYQKILELNGVKYAQYFYYIHQGYRQAAAIIASAGASLVGGIMAMQGDVSNALMLDGLAAAAFVGVPYLMDMSLNDDIKKRRLSIQIEFPEFINKLTLLVNAGMTISKAWEKIINENTKDHILYQEMAYALGEIRSGKSESVAYEEFARRCHVKEVTKFVSVIVMNLKRGGSEVVPILKTQGMECWEMRKNAAKHLGEEANSKLLIPMMIMFLGIVLIVATPAVLSMTAGM